MMETIDLIPAARALLGWSQKDLGAKAGIGVPAIANIENKKQAPRPQTMRAVTAALEAEGIEFLRNGVIRREDGIRMITGEDCYLQLLADVAETLQSAKNKELMIWCADDRKSPSAVNDRYRAMRASGIKMRQLVEDGNTYLMGPLAEYRYIPHGKFVNVVKLGYGDKFATINGKGSRVMIHRDAEAAASHRAMFELLWEILPQPTKSDADEKF